MFVSDRLVFLELHKTGCTRIRSILATLLDGELIGNHNRADPALLDGTRAFLGSVRDPWVWYTSLWAYGCDGKGGLYHALTSRSRNAEAWKETYRNSNDAEAFRTWLRMMHDRRHFSDIGEGYSDSPVGLAAGFMTYRYLLLFCTTRGQQEVLNRLCSLFQLRLYEAQNCFIDHFIRNENLEEDLFHALEKCGEEIPDEKKLKVLGSPRLNTSSKRHGPEFYYDIETTRIVAEREQLIIEKFDYRAPEV